MNARHLITLAAAVAVSSAGTAHGATALNLYFGALRDSAGLPLPDETLVVLIANTDGGAGLPGGLTTNLTTSGLEPALAFDHFGGQTLAAGGTINLDTIFYVGTVNGIATLGLDYAGTVTDNGVEVVYGGGLAVGQTFGLYWFPGLTPATNTVPAAGFQIGGFTNPDPNLGDIGMTLPSDGLFNVFQADDVTADLDGASSDISSGAFMAIVAVPEPSVALLGILGGLCLLRRRRL